MTFKIYYPCVFCMDDAEATGIDWVQQDVMELIFRCHTCGGEFELTFTLDATHTRRNPDHPEKLDV